MTVVFKSKVFSKAQDDFLRTWYNTKVKVDPANLASALGKPITFVKNRLFELGLRKTRKYEIGRGN